MRISNNARRREEWKRISTERKYLLKLCEQCKEINEKVSYKVNFVLIDLTNTPKYDSEYLMCQTEN